MGWPNDLGWQIGMLLSKVMKEGCRTRWVFSFQYVVAIATRAGWDNDLGWQLWMVSSKEDGEDCQDMHISDKSSVFLRNCELKALGLLKLLNAVASNIFVDIKHPEVMCNVPHLNKVCCLLLDFEVISKLRGITPTKELVYEHGHKKKMSCPAMAHLN